MNFRSKRIQGPITPKGNPRQRHRPGEMNKLEERYGQHLDQLVLAGTYIHWWFEDWKFRLGAERVWYTPDFIVMLPDGTLEVHETKGFMEAKAALKLRLMCAQYPFRIQLVKWVNKAWAVTFYEVKEEA